jgi:hypothetical protein
MYVYYRINNFGTINKMYRFRQIPGVVWRVSPFVGPHGILMVGVTGAHRHQLSALKFIVTIILIRGGKSRQV